MTECYACCPLKRFLYGFVGQLLVRLDRGRQLFVYDCFEFVPLSFDKFKQTAESGSDPLSEEELVAIEGCYESQLPRGLQSNDGHA